MDQKPNARKRAQRKHEKGDETEHNSTTKKEKEKALTNKLDDGQPSRASEQQTEERPQKQLLHWKEKHTHAHKQARKLS